MPSKLPQYTLRIPEKTMDKLKYIAYRNGRSATKEIEQLVIAHIERWEKERGKIEFDDEFNPNHR